MPDYRRRDHRQRVSGPLSASVRGGGDANNLATITGSLSQALQGAPKAIREQSLVTVAGCSRGMERTAAEFEAKLGEY